MSVQPAGVGCHQKLDLKFYFVPLLVLFPDPGAVITFPFSKHGDDRSLLHRVSGGESASRRNACEKLSEIQSPTKKKKYI